MSHSNKWTDKPLSLIDRAFSGNPKGVAPKKFFRGLRPRTPDLLALRARSFGPFQTRASRSCWRLSTFALDPPLLLSEQREFVSKLSDENIPLKLRISELDNEKFKNFSHWVVRPRNTVNNEFSTLQSPPSAYASKDSSSSASKAPSPPSQNTIQAQLIQCLQDRLDSLERQLNQKQHIIELLICEPATRKMHTNDTLKCSRCEVNSNSESTNKGKSTIAKNTSIVEESIFSDLTETIKNERTTAKKKKGRKRKQNKRKDAEPEKQTTTAKEKASNQENFITSNENTGDENKNSKNNKSAVNKNKNQAQSQATLFDDHSNNSNIIQNNPQKSDLETTTTTQSNDRSTASSRKNKGKHKIIVAGDSMVKNIKGKALKKRLNQNEDILIYSFPGATVNDMHSYCKPLIDRAPDTVILHCGTNNLRSKKSDIEISTEIVTLAKSIASKGIRVCVSGLIMKGDALEDKRNKTNHILRDMCQEEKIKFLENGNIDAEKHLNNSNLHLNRYGDSILANNFIDILRA